MAMTTSNTKTIRIGRELVRRAKELKIDPKTFINVDTTQSAIRFKRMAPIVIAEQLKATFTDEDKRSNKLPAFIAAFEAAQKHGITEGRQELVEWSSLQSNGEIRALLGVYNLYESNGKPVCDFIMIDISQKHTVAYERAFASFGVGMAIACLFVPVIGPALATGGLLLALKDATHTTKEKTSKEEAEALLLKTLEHYGLVHFQGQDQIALVD
ncbi:unnamed protein product [Rotaria magnacalcarata]|uniref:Uncharacterized protein n=1 Tax=Rotaria magnacalcarata TaxID=392030 RepID=A0A819FJ83_9BILA|nr:unnamed protein product [Rotaria magnacalcarata]CAF3865509.1 unnamed protein product [Rotaria magnacalcarata]